MAIQRRRVISEGFQQPDPDLGWWPAPHATCDLTILGREVIMEVDEFGYRPVPNQPAFGERTLAVFGCSFTFGWGIATDETYCAILQSRLPKWRIENHGMIGYGTAHHLIQVERALKFQSPDFVTIAWIPHHRHRTVADAELIKHYQWPVWINSPIVSHPKAYMDDQGNLQIKQISFKRPEIKDIDLSDFEPDPYYIDLVSFKSFYKINSFVRAKGIKFFITVLRGQFTPILKHMLEDAGIPWIDASLSSKEYTNLPDDGHPNAMANIYFADRIQDYIMRQI